MSGAYIKERILLFIDELDIKVEQVPPMTDEWASKSEADKNNFPSVEETKWFQHAKVKHIHEVDNNTKYLQLLSNGKHRKQKYSNSRGMVVRLLVIHNSRCISLTSTSNCLENQCPIFSMDESDTAYILQPFTG